MERLQEKNETSGCLNEKIQRHRENGENVDKRITGFDRELEEQRVSEKMRENIAYVMDSKANKNSNIEL